MLSIVAYPNPILSTKCEPVTEFNSELHAQLDEMLPIMKAAQGIGLAANQVGIGKRFFIMLDVKGKLWEFINPTITSHDGGIQINEGCLSAAGVVIQVPRSKQVTVEAFDRNGDSFTVLCEDLEAVCIQHEIDHLDGVFFIEKTSRNQRRAALKQLGLK